MSETIVLKCSRGFGQDVEGEALVTREAVHFVMDIDMQTGTGIGIGHDLRGKNVKNKILVIPKAKGGVGSSMAIAELVKNACAPKAILFDKTNPIMVQGAILADLPTMDGFDKNLATVVQSGDWIKIRPAEGVVEINKLKQTKKIGRDADK